MSGARGQICNFKSMIDLYRSDLELEVLYHFVSVLINQDKVLGLMICCGNYLFLEIISNPSCSC